MNALEMARQPKAKAELFGQKKTERVQVLLTKDGLEILDLLAEELGLSRSDLIEHMARALNATDKSLRQSFIDRAKELNDEQ